MITSETGRNTPQLFRALGPQHTDGARKAVSDYLNTGRNEVEVIITGSFKNTLVPHHYNPEVRLVTLWSFFFASETQPAGSDYQTFDYGLFEEFRLVRYSIN